MNSMKKLLYAHGEFIYVQWCCLREASSDSQNADEAPRTPSKIPTATRILAYRSHNEGHRPSTINQGFSPLQTFTCRLDIAPHIKLSGAAGMPYLRKLVRLSHKA
jgi:hypothetical protein